VQLPKGIASALVADGHADYWERDRDPGTVDAVLQVVGVAADVVGLAGTWPIVRHVVDTLVHWGRRTERDQLVLRIRGVELTVDLSSVEGDDVELVREITARILAGLPADT